jgi:NAD(P)-dependent dehydrogenase (short-subunit alcohol dehydrogenase family)
MLETRGGVAGEPVPDTFNPKGNGKIINISSLVAYQGGLNVVAYAAAKHGIQGIVSAIRKISVTRLTRDNSDQGFLERLVGEGC